MCAGGFRSPIACGIGIEECPVGLHCDSLLGVCCPLLLPLTDKRNPSKMMLPMTTAAPLRTMPPVLEPIRPSIDKREHVYEVKVGPPTGFLVETERHTFTGHNLATEDSWSRPNNYGNSQNMFVGVNSNAGHTPGLIRTASEELDPTDPIYIVPVSLSSTSLLAPDFRVEPDSGPIGHRPHHLSRKPQTNSRLYLTTNILHINTKTIIMFKPNRKDFSFEVYLF